MLFGLFSFAVFTSSAETIKVKQNTELSQMVSIDLQTPSIVSDTNNVIVIISEQAFGYVSNDTSVTFEVEARCNSPTISSRLS